MSKWQRQAEVAQRTIQEAHERQLSQLQDARDLATVERDKTEARLAELKEGRNAVAERGHCLVLGWSERALPLLAELARAMASEGGGAICVLADVPKAELQARVRAALPAKTLRGSPTFLPF